MRITILDDYQDCVRGLDCFSRLAGHEVSVLHEPLAEGVATVASQRVLFEASDVLCVHLRLVPEHGLQG